MSITGTTKVCAAMQLVVLLFIIGSVHCQAYANSGPNLCGDEVQGTLLACPLGSRCIEIGETAGGKTIHSQSCQTLDGRILLERKLERNASPSLVGTHIATSEVRPHVNH